MSTRRAFTLIEMLVVISIITLLISMLLPAFGRAKENTQRTRCAGDMRQAIVGLTTLADGNGGALPSGKRNEVSGYRAEHCIWISDELYDDLANVTSSTSLFTCANFTNGFGYNNQYGWVIGYNYLGNHPRMNELGNFVSPIRIDDDPSLPVWVDLNNYSPDGWVFAPHTGRGALNVGSGPAYYNIGLGGPTPDAVGSEGGNVGLLDTSVHWTDFADMSMYETGEFGPGSYPCYW